jgi:Tol biopolymer transport system component/DNA-binding winged helix-turn-helix (wHTH) protein
MEGIDVRRLQRDINGGLKSAQFRGNAKLNPSRRGIAVAVFEFGPFVLDPAKRSLLRDGAPQALTPKAFDLLALLMEHRERVVSKDELLKTLWPDAFIEESNLAQHVFLLRRALNGDAEGPEYIATIPRRGYRFVAQVSERREEHIPEQIPTAPAAASPLRTRIPWVWVATALAGAVVLSALLARGALTRPQDGTENSRVIPVVAQAGVQGFPSISPDGNFVAFAWTGPQNAGPADIWIKAVEGDALRQLTATSDGEGQPMWSPDGRQIAFLRNRHGVFVMSSLGGSERNVAISGSMLGWTPDSHSLLVRDRVGQTPFGIFQIDLETGTRRQLTQAPSGIGDWTFDVSPDGTMLAFVRYERPGVSDVYIAPMVGGDANRRTDWGLPMSRVVWTADGQELIYAVDEGGAQTLFRIPASGPRPERGRRALHVSAVGPSLSRAAAGQFARLAFISRREDVGLRLVDLVAPRKGDVFQNVERFADSTRIELPGSFSPQGDRIAFASNRSGSLNVWVANHDGSGARQLTSFTAADLMIGNWSADGRQLVIDASENGNSDLYRVGVDSGQVSRLTVESSIEMNGQWSRDGRWIFFSSNRSGVPQVWKMPAAGGPAVPVTKAGGLEPQEAPDGRTIFYLDHPPPGAGGLSGSSRLMKVSVDGGEEVIVLDAVRLSLWSVIEQGIVFVTVEPESDALDFYSFSDHQVRRLGTLPFRISRVAGYGELAVSRDGRLAMLNATDNQQADIMVADRFR